MTEEDLQKEISQYTELANKDKNVNASALVINALEHHDDDNVSVKSKRYAYLFSFLFMPLGLFVAVYYFAFSEKKDANKVALVCILISIFTAGAFLILFQIILSSSNVSTDQLQQTPQLLNDLLN